MARTELTVANGYIVEEHSSTVVQAALQNSAVEKLARREPMATSIKRVPRFVGDAPVVYAEGATIGESDVTIDDITLTARKWAKIMHISEEDLNDSFLDVLNTYKTQWATNWAKKFDNACLGVTAAAAGTDAAPYTSVYRAVSQYNSASNRIQSAGAITFDDLNQILSKIEDSAYFDPSKTVFIAHPQLLATLRGLVDSQNRPILQDPLGPTTGTLFGYPLTISTGAMTGSAASATPSGNALLIAGNTDLMINGVRAGIESMVSKDAKFDTDGVLLKVRARRAFDIARAEGFAVLEKTASA
jgi:HK97 family phage major capsid protein